MSMIPKIPSILRMSFLIVALSKFCQTSDVVKNQQNEEPIHCDGTKPALFQMTFRLQC